ncbi:hypothetical protein [Halalkalirubrum salinum]|uniref:hypothetical protein n=1 Tax=Halalkalirubrum salinum TaxID=2563889 RepID=UPI001F0EC971|nr:hypothetical protein [Halalkalirubrum salinum]
MLTTAIAGVQNPIIAFPIGLTAGILGTLVMDRIMAALPEGTTPPTIAAGVLTETHPDSAPKRLATVVHYLAGTGAGALFIWFLLAGTAIVGSSLAALLASTIVYYALMVGFFVFVPLQLVTGISTARKRSIARDWAISAAGYLFVLVPVVVVVLGLIG